MNAVVAMLTLRVLWPLPIILSTVVLKQALANPEGLISDSKGASRTRLATSLTGGEGCDDDDLDDIRAGFAEMVTIFQATIPFDPTGQPSTELFGTTSMIQNYTNMISNNLQRAANYAKLEGGEGPANADIHVRCDDPMTICRYGNEREGSHSAYNIGNEPHVNFCDGYFGLDGLDKRVNKKADDQLNKDSLTEYYTRATLWARMVMHFSEIGRAVVVRAIPAPPESIREWALITSEGAMNTSVLAGVMNERPENGPNHGSTLKYAYGVTRAKLLAVLSTQMPYDAANNAENYALYAQARYVLQQKGFYPNVPVMDFPNEASVLTNENLQDGERAKFAFFDMTDVVCVFHLLNCGDGSSADILTDRDPMAWS